MIPPPTLEKPPLEIRLALIGSGGWLRKNEG